MPDSAASHTGSSPTDETVRQTPTDIAESMQLSLEGQRPPIRIPGYQLGRCLGRGAYGAVWLATERNTGKQVAIKLYSHRQGLDWSLLNREVEKLAVLYTSRNIVRLLDVGWDADPPYYVMEYLERGSLSLLLAQQRLSLSESVSLLRGVLHALVHAHGSGILHCDIKPANILLDADQQPRLADFGQSRLSHEQQAALGTLFYMAPEQADLDAVPDARWDVYAVGAVLYQCLTGKVPHFSPERERHILNAPSVEERLGRYQQLLRDAPAPTEHRNVPGIDRRLIELVDRCLEVDPQRRFPNAQAILDAFNSRDRFLTRRPLLFIGMVVPIVLLLGFGTLGYYAFGAAVRSAQETLVTRALESNAVAARILGHSVQRELEDRIAELQKVAADDRVRQALLSEQGKPWSERRELRSVLDQWKQLVDRDRQAQHQELDTSWFLNNRSGVQVYRAPYDERTVDKDYSYRDYFHGQGHDFDAATAPQTIEPVHTAYVSVKYTSQSSNSRRVAITVPIWDADHKTVIGILGRSLAVGKLLQGYKGVVEQASVQRAERVIALLDIRDFTPLDHEWMTDENLNRNPGDPIRDLPFDVKLKQQIQELDKIVVQEKEISKIGLQGQDRTEHYTDPIAKLASDRYGGEWLAAFWPAGETRWIAIVQERKSSALVPMDRVRERLLRYAVFGLLLCAFLVAILWYSILRSFAENNLSVNGHPLESPEAAKTSPSTLP